MTRSCASLRDRVRSNEKLLGGATRGCLFAPYLKAHFNFSIVEYEKPVPVAMMITNPYVAHALFANRREPTPLDDEPTLLD